MIKLIIKRICSFIDIAIILLFLYLLSFYFFKMLLFILFPIILYFIASQSISLLYRNRLNKLYSYKFHRKSNEYELQYNPPFGFHWINKERFLFLRQDAIYKLKIRFNNPNIVGITMTLNNINEYSNYEQLYVYGKFKRLLLIPQNSILTIINIRNIFSLSLSYKLCLIAFKNNLVKYRYL